MSHQNFFSFQVNVIFFALITLWRMMAMYCLPFKVGPNALTSKLLQTTNPLIWLYDLCQEVLKSCASFEQRHSPFSSYYCHESDVVVPRFEHITSNQTWLFNHFERYWLANHYRCRICLNIMTGGKLSSI